MSTKLNGTPRRPDGDDDEAIFMQWVYDWLTKRGRLINKDGEITFSYTEKGIIPSVPRRPGGSTTTTGGGMNYRGQWTAAPASPYMEFDVVLILTGTASGTYISVVDNNTNAPDTGIGWVQIAPGDAVGRWS